MPVNEIIGFTVGSLIIGIVLWFMARPQAVSKRRRLDPFWFGGGLQSALRAYREDQLGGDKHLPRYNRVRTYNAVFLLGLVVLILVVALLTEFWQVQDVPRPIQPGRWQ